MGKVDFTDSELVVFKNSQEIKARGTLLKLAQNHIVFEVYNPYLIVQLSEVLKELIITRAEKQIYNGKAVVTNIVNTGIVLIVSATLSDLYWKNTVDVRSEKDIQSEINLLIERFEETEKINPNFRASVLSIRSFLSDVRNWLEKLEPALEISGINVDTIFIKKNFDILFRRMAPLFKAFEDAFSAASDDKLNFYKNFTQSHLHHFVMSSPFPYRVYSKPLGYAGDYEMMKMIQRENAEGSSLYSKFINVFFTNQPIPISVKNRTKTLVKLIEDSVRKAETKGQDFYLLSIGCGPALEIKEFFDKNQNIKTKCHFKLLDFNQETLNFAVNQSNLAKGSLPCEINGELNSVHELLKRSVGKKGEESKYDLIYCSGLFDYLSNRVCAKLIKLFYSMLKPNGKVLVTNMHINNPDQYMMELLLDWYLIYRDENDMKNLAPDFGEQSLYTDSTGVNLCLEITKND